jgi:hypothetical protein
MINSYGYVVNYYDGYRSPRLQPVVALAALHTSNRPCLAAASTPLNPERGECGTHQPIPQNMHMHPCGSLHWPRLRYTALACQVCQVEQCLLSFSGVMSLARNLRLNPLQSDLSPTPCLGAAACWKGNFIVMLESTAQVPASGLCRVFALLQSALMARFSFSSRCRTCCLR